MFFILASEDNNKVLNNYVQLKNGEMYMKKWLTLGVFAMNMQAAEFKLNSLDFENGKRIPKEFTCEGSNKILNKLVWENPPVKTKSFALICDDPDAPDGTFTHWVVYNIPEDKRSLDYIKDHSEKLADGTLQGINSSKNIGYVGPCPPKGNGTHHYHFKLYALDARLNLKPGATKEHVFNAMKGHVLAHAEIIGIYEHS